MTCSLRVQMTECRYLSEKYPSYPYILQVKSFQGASVLSLATHLQNNIVPQHSSKYRVFQQIFTQIYRYWFRIPFVLRCAISRTSQAKTSHKLKDILIKRPWRKFHIFISFFWWEELEMNLELLIMPNYGRKFQLSFWAFSRPPTNSLKFM